MSGGLQFTRSKKAERTVQKKEAHQPPQNSSDEVRRYGKDYE